MTLSDALLVTSAVASAALLGILAVQLYRRSRPFLPPQVDREPKEPPRVHLRALRDLVGRRTPAPGIPHEGATVAFGGELRDLRDAPVAAELVTTVEQAAVDHAQLDEIAVAKAACHVAVWGAIEHFLRDHPDVALRVRAAVDQTAELDVAELRRALDDDQRLYAWAAGDYATAVTL